MAKAKNVARKAYDKELKKIRGAQSKHERKMTGISRAREGCLPVEYLSGIKRKKRHLYQFIQFYLNGRNSGINTHRLINSWVDMCDALMKKRRK